MALYDAIDLGDQQAEVIRKDIKHVHLGVYPPDGHIRISAPKGMALDTIRIYAITKLDWIRRQQRKMLAQQRETAREYVDRESHYVWGKRYLLKILHEESAPRVVRRHSVLELHVRPDSGPEKRQEVLEAWYRGQLRAEIPKLLEKWQPIVGARPRNVLVQRMKTKWGSCNHESGNIRLNTDLARKPLACLEYILMHEMVHLIEPNHGVRFQSLMDQFMPHWRQIRQELNELPIRHENWGY